VPATRASGWWPGGHGTAFPLIAPYRGFHTREGDLMIAAGNDGLFARLCETLGVPELATDPRFATNPDRVARRAELAELIQSRIGDEPLSEVLSRLERAGVPAAPVNDVGQVARHEQTAALGLIQSMPEPTVALPLSIDGERVLHRLQPPRLGEDTDEVLRDLGYTGAELAALAADCVIRRVESSE